MNELIDSIFGDQYITLKCNSGECLHYTQIPGYVVSNAREYDSLNSQYFSLPQSLTILSGWLFQVQEL
jgi:hypothetical protein